MSFGGWRSDRFIPMSQNGHKTLAGAEHFVPANTAHSGVGLILHFGDFVASSRS